MSISRFRFRNFFACALIAGACSHSAAGLFDDEEARRAILDLRQKLEALRSETDLKVNELQRSSADESAQLRRSLVELQNQLEASRAESSRLRGQAEQLAKDLSDLQRKQKDGMQATDDRLRKLEPTKIVWDGREFFVETAEKRDFDTALAAFRKGDFAAAESLFSDFLIRYSGSGFRPSALFWSGSAQYATKDYKAAQISFRSLIQQAPDHLRAPEALLALANCFLELKDTRSGKRTLEELVANYPTSEAASAAKDRLVRLK
jgi:tol-pal system protein YbgF